MSIHLSVAAHTNAGKTTLVRTLLKRDIGEVADRPHVTEESERHLLVDTPGGDALYLWDTPGFGDSVRLEKRLQASGNPVGWFLTQVWDRLVDRPFFCSQQAVRNVREESDVVLGLGVGADDYVTKPFSPRELTARVKAVLRRAKTKGDGDRRERVAFEGVVIDPQRHEVKVDGESVALTATEFRLLHFLASHPGRVFTRDHLLTRVIGEDAIVIDRNIDVHVRAIRKKLGTRREFIETIRGVGYRFKD